MKTYLSYFIDAKGKRRLEQLKAQNRVQCFEILAARDIVPIGVWLLPFSQINVGGKLPLRGLALFFGQLAMALKSGVSLMDALYYMEKEQTNERMRALLGRFKEGIMAGRSLSDCVRCEKALPQMIGDWIAIGEKQGRLVQILEDVAAHLEQETQMKKQLQQQLLYPLVVLGAIVLVVHDFFAAYGGVMLLVLLVGVVWMFAARFSKENSSETHSLLREMVLSIPLLKKVCVLKVYVPFARFLGQLLSSGVPADEAISAVESYFARSLFARDINQVKTWLVQGGSLSLAISESVFVPDLAKQMLLNGERYGRMPEALLNSADYYERT